jgi:hypothetical protein
MTIFQRTLLIAALACLIGAPQARALVLPEMGEMTPHRAVYEIRLGRATSAAGVTDVRGRLVFEFNGSPCEGFTQNLRFVMSITNREGTVTVSDLRSTTWEEATGGQFRFDIETLENQQPSEKTTGTAARDGTGRVEIALTQPAATTLAFPGPVLFPLQHTATLIAAAKRGDARLEANVYDGSDLGQKVFQTAAAIGRAGTGNDSELDGIANAKPLKGQPSWPMTIAYFNAGSGLGDGTPEHEMSFRVYANGVIRSVKLDYGTLTLDGQLSQIDYLEAKACGN